MFILHSTTEEMQIEHGVMWPAIDHGQCVCSHVCVGVLADHTANMAPNMVCLIISVDAE